jgi:hypothetical protein
MQNTLNLRPRQRIEKLMQLLSLCSVAASIAQAIGQII